MWVFFHLVLIHSFKNSFYLRYPWQPFYVLVLENLSEPWIPWAKAIIWLITLLRAPNPLLNTVRVAIFCILLACAGLLPFPIGTLGFLNVLCAIAGFLLLIPETAWSHSGISIITYQSTSFIFFSLSCLSIQLRKIIYGWRKHLFLLFFCLPANYMDPVTHRNNIRGMQVNGKKLVSDAEKNLY